MRFLDDFCLTVANIPLGEYYPLIFTISLTVSVWSFAVLLITVRAVRKVNAYWVLTASLTILASVACKIFCDCIKHSPPNVFCVGASLALLPLTILGCAFCHVFSQTRKTLLSSEKRLIDRLLKEEEPEKSILNSDSFSKAPFKRVEYLNTQKGFSSQGFSDFNLNPSYVEKCILSLSEKELCPKDKFELEKISDALQKYKLKNLSDFERDDFSTNLQKLLKLTAKYDTANFDRF